MPPQLPPGAPIEWAKKSRSRKKKRPTAEGEEQAPSEAASTQPPAESLPPAASPGPEMFEDAQSCAVAESAVEEPVPAVASESNAAASETAPNSAEPAPAPRGWGPVGGDDTQSHSSPPLTFNQMATRQSARRLGESSEERWELIQQLVSKGIAVAREEAVELESPGAEEEIRVDAAESTFGQKLNCTDGSEINGLSLISSPVSINRDSHTYIHSQTRFKGRTQEETSHRSQLECNQSYIDKHIHRQIHTETNTYTDKYIYRQVHTQAAQIICYDKRCLIVFRMPGRGALCILLSLRITRGLIFALETRRSNCCWVLRYWFK